MAYGAPNFLAAIDAFRQGRDDARRSYLQDLDERARGLQGKALQGDQSALAELSTIKPEAYMQTQQFTDAQKKERLGEFLSAAYGAKTPEAWNGVVQRFAAQGHKFAPGEDAFENRENLIRQGMSVAEQMGMDFRQSEAARSQANSDRAYNLDERQFAASQQNAANKGPDLVELYDDATGQPYKARYNPKTGGFDRVGGVKAPNGTQLEVGPNGEVSFTQGMGKPLTEGQSKDTAYLTRMAEAVPLIDQMGDKLTSFGENVGGRMPLVGNYLKSPEYQAAEQAAGVWRQAFLRKDSGAQISESERADTNQLYIPQPGDKAPVLLQKAKARRTATLAVKLGLPYKAVMEMQKAGIDVDKIISAPLPGAQGGKTDQQPRIRTYNPATGELE